MILQIGAFFGNLFEGITSSARSLGEQFLPQALQVGQQFTTSLINRELNRDAVNASQDRQKAQLRAAANAVSRTAAVGQTAVPSGGPAIGTAFQPPTLIPPSIQPPQRVLQTDPDFFPRNRGQQFRTSRRPAPLFEGEQFLQPAFMGALAGPILRGGAAIGRRFANRAFEAIGRTGQTIARAPVGVQLGALGAAAVGAEAAVGFGLDAVFNPSTAFAPTILQDEGVPLRIGGPLPTQTQVPTGLPARGVYQKEPNGFQVQWYAMVGGQLQPITRGQAECLKRDCIYRLNVFTGDFQKLKSRRINPMNVRAFFRAGRRVDAGERICRKMFSEHRKKKTGAIRRKSRKKKR